MYLLLICSFPSEMTKIPLRDLSHASVNLNWVKSCTMRVNLNQPNKNLIFFKGKTWLLDECWGLVVWLVWITPSRGRQLL